MNWMQNCWYWRMAIVRCIIYGGMVAWPVFKAGTNGFTSLHEMTSLQRWDLFGDMAIAFAGVVLAFLDNTLALLRNGGNGTATVTTAVATVTTEVQKSQETPAQPKDKP